MIKYAKGPVSFLYADTPDKKGVIARRKSKQVLWGDWIRVIGPDEKSGWLQVKYGKSKYFMRKKDLQDDRVLEIIFLDVGQGDGCILTEPGRHANPRIVVIDAGEGTNMHGYLKWRFRDFPEWKKLHATIITHPDTDHYQGFSHIFKDDALPIDHVYHNGLVERTGDNPLGPVEDGFLTDIIADNDDAAALLADSAVRGSKLYPKLLKSALDADHIDEVRALTTNHATQEDGRSWMPGFAPQDPGPVNIEVIGPVVEPLADGTSRLRAFGASPTSTSIDIGKTKNGHSVLLRLEFNGFRVLFGGDLNTSAETFLVLWYGNDETVPPPLTKDDELLETLSSSATIEAARERLAVDLMKTCHHGSSDTTEEFLSAALATAYVISSGDEESHVHPRPDLLGLLGKAGRGPRPLLLSTELLRSTREKEKTSLRTTLDKLNAKIEAELQKPKAHRSPDLSDWYKERRSLQDQIFKRNVGVYGAVNLRTDGEKAIIAFRKESGAATSRWFFYELTRNMDGDFETGLKGS